MPRVSEVFVKGLFDAGITAAFGNPGSFEQAFLDAFDAHPGMRYVLCLHESVAVAAAMGHARAVKRPAFIQLHAGVGLGNAAAMLDEAKRSKVPLLVFTGEAALFDEGFQGFLATDIPALARPCCKAAVRVAHPLQFARQLRRAIQLALAPPAGPVVISVPTDVMEAMIPPEDLRITSAAPAGEADAARLAAAADMLATAGNPAILVGDGVAWSGAIDVVHEVARAAGAAILALGGSMCNARSADDLFQGFLSYSQGEGNRALLQSHDVVLLAGGQLGAEVFPAAASPLAPGTKLIQVDSDAEELGRNHPADVSLLGDIRSTLANLLKVIQPSDAAAHRCRSLAAFKQAEQTRKQAALDAAIAARPNHPAAYLRAIVPEFPADALVYEEAMTSQAFLQQALPRLDPEHYFPALSRPLGAGWPGAVGVKLARPQNHVVAISSDGAALYVPQALWTAAHLKLDMTFIVLNNAGYRVLKLNADRCRSRLGVSLPTYPHLDLDSPAIDFVKLAESMGVPGETCTTPGAARAAMARARSVRGPVLLDLHIDGAVSL